MEELETCHELDYIAQIKELEAKSNEELIEMSHNRDSVYYNQATYASASLAAGCVLNVVDQVCTKKVRLLKIIIIFIQKSKL